MPSSIEWYVPKRVMYARLWGVLTPEEGQANNARATQLVEEGIPLVHTLLDDGGVEKMPMSLSDAKRTMKVYQHPSVGWMISIGDANPFIRFVSYIMTQMSRVRFRRFSTIEEAVAFLKEQDTTINWAEADESVLQRKSTEKVTS